VIFFEMVHGSVPLPSVYGSTVEPLDPRTIGN
jgi:hypothetical protein